MPLSLFPYGVMKVKSWEWLLSWMVFPGLNASHCQERLPFSQGWSPSQGLHRLSVGSCCLFCLHGVSYVGLSPSMFSHVFLYCQNSSPSLPYYKPADHSALLGRIINQSSVNPCYLPRPRYRVAHVSSSLIKAWSSSGKKTPCFSNGIS